MFSNGVSKTILILFVIFSLTHGSKQRFHNLIKKFKPGVHDVINHKTNNFVGYLINHAKTQYKKRGIPFKYLREVAYDTDENSQGQKKDIDLILQKLTRYQQGSEGLTSNNEDNLDTKHVLKYLTKIDKEIKEVNLDPVTEEWHNILDKIHRFAAPLLEQLETALIVYKQILGSAGLESAVPAKDLARSDDERENMVSTNGNRKELEQYSEQPRARFIVITDRNKDYTLRELQKALDGVAENHNKD